MCGIAGSFSWKKDARTDPEVVRRMCAAMTHRGPDDEGVYTHGGVGLGMRRLSIIDLAAGHQPISNEDGSIWIVFNGEIYNHSLLRERLLAQGHQFKTQCDTETIVHLYEEFGRNCVQHLRGMFAFTLWDSRKRIIFAARDRLGIKPFYYSFSEKLWVFGSEIKVLLEHPQIPADFRRGALGEYLVFGYLSGEDTLYKGIRKLMPGHWLEVDENGNWRSEPYWDLKLPAPDKFKSAEFYIHTYRELLTSAVKSHLMSDVPLGVFLSGGLDSSAVAALMTNLRQKPVDTFSVGYSEQAYSELPYARTVAQHLKATHREVEVSRSEFFDTLPLMIRHEDEPLVWPSSVALYFVARLARQHVKVVLTGEGSDETLGGYGRYATTLKNLALNSVYRHLVPHLLREKLRGAISSSPLLKAELRRKLGHTFLGRDGQSFSSLYLDNFFAAFSELEQSFLLTDRARAEQIEGASYANVISYWEQSSGEPLQRLLYTDIKTYMVELLMKQDNMSMAASIESRVPFLDHPLVEFAVQLPQSRLPELAGKSVLKNAVRDLLPPSILNRRKLGFPTPWASWLHGPQLASIESLLCEPRSIDRGLFRLEAVKQLFEQHRARKVDNGDRIWRLLNLELWQRICLEGESHHGIAEKQERLAYTS